MFQVIPVLVWFSLTLVQQSLVECLSLEDAKDPNVKFHDDGLQFYTLSMNENIPKATLFLIADATGNIKPLKSADGITQLCSDFFYGYSLNNAGLYLNTSLDYEQANCQKITFEISDSESIVTVKLEVINLDDNPPQFFSTPECRFKENTHYTIKDTVCNLTLRDADGMMDNKLTIAQTDQPTTTFIVDFMEKPKPDDKEAIVGVALSNGITLDYEDKNFFILNLTAKGTELSSSVQVIVNVQDMPDQPPDWKSTFVNKQFEENIPQTFILQAIDGDLGIHNKIEYSITQDGCKKNNFKCKIDIDKNSGSLSISGVDREEVGDTIALQVGANEVVEHPEDGNSSVHDITFIIEDQDDNSPVIKILGSQQEYQENDGEVKFQIDENFAGVITSFSVTDMDLADNGTFTLKLFSIGAVDYTIAFQIIPVSGYQNSDFTLAVADPEKLDYEDPTWRNITFQLKAIEKANEAHLDWRKISINLNNLNDEPPIFTNISDSVSVPENITKGELIFNAAATDKDGDTVIYQIPGIWSEQLDISKDGIISPRLNGVFDYERLQQVIIQVLATDKVHNTYKTLSINVTDVDDEQPTVSVGSQRVTISENCSVGTEPTDYSIYSTDPDTKPKLTLKIDWATSFVTKNSVKVQYDEDIWHCFDLKQIASGDAQKISGKLEVNEMCSPDFEKYDVMSIGLIVTDENTVSGQPDNTGAILINILDINDNAPEFVESSLLGLEVADGSTSPTNIGIIAAHDDDINDKTTFIIKNLDPHTDWVDISESGQLFVKEGITIDDDIPKRQSISFNITAFDNDKVHNTTTKITIKLTDVNDEKPTILHTETNKTIREKSISGTSITQLTAEDNDRDDPYNRVVFQFDSNITDAAANRFNISEGGKILVNLRNKAILDRDFIAANYVLPILAYDNPKGKVQFQDHLNFLVILEDINDQTPVITTESLTCSESMKKGDTIGPILAEDKDGPGPNSEISFEIVKITRVSELGQNDLNISFFNISAKENSATLLLLKDLENYYGTFNLSITVKDGGTPSREQTYTVQLTVEKFNFKSPVFKFPKSDNMEFILEEKQIQNSRLQLLDGGLLQDIEVDDLQGHKWDVSFKISNKDDLFTLLKMSRYTARLQLSRSITKADIDVDHKITVEASVKNDKQENEANPSVQIKMTMKVFNVSQPPAFPSQCSSSMSIELEEDNLFATSAIPCKAVYESGIKIPVYYFLQDESAEFAVQPTTGLISLKKPLDYEEAQSHTILIQASNSKTDVIPNPPSNSVLNVTIEVIDMNDNVPIFHPSSFHGAYLKTSSMQSIILKVNATDEDQKDKSHLHFALSEFNCEMKQPPTSHEPFKIDSMGQITPLFAVTSEMSGYCSFSVHATDNPDKNGTVHTTSTTVQINIISDSELVELHFLNKDETVQSEQGTISTILDSIFSKYGYQSNVADIIPVSSINTTAHFYFLDKNQNPVEAEEIMGNLTDVDKFVQVKNELRTIGVNLESFSDPMPYQLDDDYIKTWLFASTSILGILLILVSTVFFFRNKALTNRIKNLSTPKFGSQESGLNRAGLAAPTTNINAVEGSNPIYNSEHFVKEMSDRDSVFSNDSELFGIEDRPEFALR